MAELRRKLAALSGGSSGYDAVLGPAGAAPPAPSRIVDPEGPVLAAPGPIAAVLPAGGVPRGSVVTVGSTAPGGSGATSLLLTLMAAPPGAWVAAVGLPDLGLLAAAELGVDLSRLGLVPAPESRSDVKAFDRTVLYGHASDIGHHLIFQDLSALKTGDSVTVDTSLGRFVYAVTTVATRAKANLDDMAELYDYPTDGRKELALVACLPDTTSNVVVFAALVTAQGLTD